MRSAAPALDQPQQQRQRRGGRDRAQRRHRHQVEMRQHHLGDGQVGAPARADENHRGEGRQHMTAIGRHRVCLRFASKALSARVIAGEREGTRACAGRVRWAAAFALHQSRLDQTPPHLPIASQWAPSSPPLTRRRGPRHERAPPPYDGGGENAAASIMDGGARPRSRRGNRRTRRVSRSRRGPRSRRVAPGRGRGWRRPASPAG